jgi:hypothetical protein
MIDKEFEILKILTVRITENILDIQSKKYSKDLISMSYDIGYDQGKNDELIFIYKELKKIIEESVNV